MSEWARVLEPMLRARRFDETLLGHSELITGAFHVSIGLEAGAAALALARRPGDLVMLNHRNHGPLTAMGSDAQVMFAEIFGRDVGPQRGRAGTLHLADHRLGVPYTSAMVGGGVGLAVGAALARRLRAEEGIAFALFGDGALGEGAVYEALNLAALWHAPLLFLCESNAEPVGGRANAHQAAGALLDLAQVHGIPGVWVQGSSARDVVTAVSKSVEAIRRGQGPRFVEVRTVPWPGNRTFRPHLVDGPLDLASALEAYERPLSAWARADPVVTEAGNLLADRVPLSDLLRLDSTVRSDIERAAAAATRAKPPAPDVAYLDVWSRR